MDSLFNWFQSGNMPERAVDGHYNWGLVALSFAVSVLAAYIALDLVGRYRIEQKKSTRYYWFTAASFTLGSGMWVVHYIIMLAFVMPVTQEYIAGWTAASMLAAIVSSGTAIWLLRNKSIQTYQLWLSGSVLGLGITFMHYLGMQSMLINFEIYYVPVWFIFSVLIAFGAAISSMFFAYSRGEPIVNKNRLNVSALLLGIGICGTVYIGLEGTVFFKALHNTRSDYFFNTIKDDQLAFFMVGLTVLIISVSLTASGYYKQMVNAIENEKEFLNVMLDNLEDGIIACDDTGRITVLNQYLQKNMDPSKPAKKLEDLTDLFGFETMDEKPVQGKDFPLTRAFNGDMIHREAFIMKFNDHIVRDVVIDGQQIINAKNKKLGAVTVIHDVTELKKTEKLKNEFVSIVSHELRTPLTSIRGSLGLLVSGIMGEFPEKAKKLLEIANSNCERLLLLINDILDIEKIEAGKMKFDMKTVSINEIIKESIEANKMYAEKFGLSLDYEPAAKDSAVTVDPDRLMQVLANLISNACKFSPQGTRVVISVIGTRDWVRVSVKDMGPGIPLEFQSRIFQKFSQADSSDTRGKAGTGLGLNISKTIIEKFGGRLNFNSVADEGATFFFELPVVMSDGSALLEDIEEEPPLPKKRLLICEDDDDQAEYLRVLLESAGFITDVANTVGAAKKLIAQHDYEALLLDLILPDQDGIAFIRELRETEATASLHIIVLSVIAQTGRSLMNGDALSVVDWLDKPIDFNTLLSSINRVKKRGDSELPHILHVEDNPDTQHVISVLLEKHAKVSKAGNLQEAKEMLEKNSYDLVILDLLLPDGNGTEILPLLARHHVPVLVFSATTLNENYAKFVSKALMKSNSSNETLLDTIKNLLKG